MIQPLELEISAELQGAIIDADFERFRHLMESNKIDPSSFLFSKARKLSSPLLQKAIDGKYTNKNCESRLKIVRYLLEACADVNVTAPFGMSSFGAMLHLNHCLDTTTAKYEVYLFTLVTALDMLRNFNADANVLSDNLSSYLDQCVALHRKYVNWKQEDLAKASSKLVELLLQKGASGSYRNRLDEVNGLEQLFELYKENENVYVPKHLTIPRFDLFQNSSHTSDLVALWNNQTLPKSKALQAIKFLEDAIYLHAERGSFVRTNNDNHNPTYDYAPAIKQAMSLLTDFSSQLELKQKKVFLVHLKKITTRSKPCYDYAVYEQMYVLVAIA
jgi:hypothetical protein